MDNPGDRARPASFIEAYHMIKYIQEHYDVECEVHFAMEETQPRTPVLCITGVGRCWYCRQGRVFHWWDIEVPYEKLQKLPELLQGAFFSVVEELDDLKQMCSNCLTNRVDEYLNYR